MLEKKTLAMRRRSLRRSSAHADIDFRRGEGVRRRPRPKDWAPRTSPRWPAEAQKQPDGRRRNYKPTSGAPSQQAAAAPTTPKTSRIFATCRAQPCAPIEEARAAAYATLRKRKLFNACLIPASPPSPRRFWRWMTEYWRFRIGRRHPFPDLDEGGDNGVYNFAAMAVIRSRSRQRLGNRDRRGGSSGACVETWRPHYPMPFWRRLCVGDPGGSGREFSWAGQSPLPALRRANGLHGARRAERQSRDVRARLQLFRSSSAKLGLRGSPHSQRASCCPRERPLAHHCARCRLQFRRAPILEHFLEPDCALPAELVEWLRAVDRPRPMILAEIIISEPSPICLALRSLLSEAGAATG